MSESEEESDELWQPIAEIVRTPERKSHLASGQAAQDEGATGKTEGAGNTESFGERKNTLHGKSASAPQLHLSRAEETHNEGSTGDIKRIRSIIQVGGEAGASFTTVSAPVDLHISPSELANLSDERRAIVNLISTTVKQNLTRWDQFTFQLPETEFSVNSTSGESLEPIVSLASLCVEPDETSELDEITRDPETGDRRRLTAEQCRDIAENGRFSFPSQRNVHVNHVWQLTPWMIRGHKRVRKDFKRRSGNALDHLLVHLPNRIGTGFLSITNGIFRIGREMKGILEALIGFPETVPKRTEDSYRKDAEKEYVKEKCIPTELLDFEHYFNLHSDERWNERRTSAYDETYRLAALETFKHVSPDALSTKDRITRIGGNLQEKSREADVQSILRDDRNGDDHKRSVMAEHLRAKHIIQDGQKKLSARTENEKLRFIEEARQNHPILSLSQTWLQKRVWRKGMQHYAEWEREQQDEDISLMGSRGLLFAVRFEESRLQFQREAWPDIRKTWLRDRVGARVYEHPYVVFDPRRWREGVEVDRRRVRTTTANAGWRLLLILRDTRSFLRNGIYFTVVTNLWRGPLGIRALFSSENVPYSWEIGKNGAVRVRSLRMSMYTRVRAIWRRVHEHREAFEADTSVLGKDAVRWIHFIVNYGFRGVVSTTLVIIGQPVLTAVNVPATVIITATSVVWAPISAFAAYCISWLVYDRRSFKRHTVQYLNLGNASDVFTLSHTRGSPKWFPVPLHLLRAVLGILECLTSTVGLVVHPAYAMIRSAFACVQCGVRVAWEGTWHALLRRYGRWPARDSFLAKRVRGAGVSGSYYFRLSTDLVMRSLRASLELIELEEAQEVIEKAVKLPMRELKSFTKDVLTGLCEEPGSWAWAIASLLQEEYARLKHIREVFEKRKTMLSRLTVMPARKTRIRPEKGVPPDQVLSQCVEVVEKFFEERIAKLGEVSTRLWRQAGAAPGDVKTLTRYLLADLFSEEFLCPVEESEETLELPVTFENIINVYAKPVHRQ